MMAPDAIRRVAVTTGLSVALAVALWVGSAHAEPLMVTDTIAPDVSCLFNKACTVTVADTAGTIAIAGISGRAVLQSRTFAGAAGSPADGLTAYEFRVDLTQATAGPAKACVTRLILPLDPLRKLDYPGSAGPGEVFVITKGGIGTVGLLSADRKARVVTFTFVSPICPGTGGAKGATSYFFGFAAVARPQLVKAWVELDNGTTVDVATRAPAP